MDSLPLPMSTCVFVALASAEKINRLPYLEGELPTRSFNLNCAAFTSKAEVLRAVLFVLSDKKLVMNKNNHHSQYICDFYY
jgi:hypothetical protein